MRSSISIAAVLCSVYRPVFSFTCDATLVSSAGITTIEAPEVAHVQAGTFVELSGVDGCPSSFVASTNMCRITMQVATSTRSSIYVEVWMPDEWQGRYISTGNSGLDGCVNYDDLEYLSSLQFAVGGANGGYNGNTGSSFANNLEVIKDYSFRSVHNMTIISKQLVTKYYNSAPNKSYFYGCSTGGRQGLQSAQMFPKDFDGIIAGAPAADFNNLAGWAANVFLQTGPDGSDTFLTATQWENIQNSVIQACDDIDGVIDGNIEDPDLCNFDLQTLKCGTTSSSSDCLTEQQFQTATNILGPLRDSHEKLLYPQWQPGTEGSSFGFYFAGYPNSIPTGWFENAIFPNDHYDPSGLTIKDIVFGDTLDLGNISSWSGNLANFNNYGGKLITVHGLADTIITSTNSKRYYKHVSATMNLPPVSLDAFYRYFRISGMDHCGGGSGASSIGLTGSNEPFTTEQNVVKALINWVENGKAPETLLGKSGNGKFQRNHCRFPYRTTYRGGNPAEAASWNCTQIVDPNLVMAEET